MDANEDDSTAAACAVLQHCLGGKSLPVAIELVAASHALQAPDVKRFWSTRKDAALIELTIGRIVDAVPWSDGEMERLAQIFREET